jgi:hypothetical protein
VSKPRNQPRPRFLPVSFPPCCVCSQQQGETLLPEMMIKRQDFGDGFLTHGLHRDAVGQAVFLVRAGLVESKAVKND